MKTFTVEADYMNLVRRFPLRPIHSKAEHRRAAGILVELSALGDARLTDGQADYLAALARFVDDYEHDHLLPALGSATPLDILHHLMESRAMTSADLGDVLGSRPAATMILNGRREMSKTHIRALAAYFSVSPGLFL